MPFKLTVVARMRPLVAVDAASGAGGSAPGSVPLPTSSASSSASTPPSLCSRVAAAPHCGVIVALPTAEALREAGPAARGTSASLIAALAPGAAAAAATPPPDLPSIDAALAAVPGARRFGFDAVFGGGASQAEVFRAAVAPAVSDALAGRAAVVLCYGQTGALGVVGSSRAGRLAGCGCGSCAPRARRQRRQALAPPGPPSPPHRRWQDAHHIRPRDRCEPHHGGGRVGARRAPARSARPL